MPRSDADRIAQALRAADERARPIGPVRHEADALDVEAAYDIQRRVIEGRLASGARRLGRKVGLTSRAVQDQLGVSEPDFGVLLDDMRVEDNGFVHVGELISPRVEAEIAFVLGSDLDAGLDLQSVADAVSYAAASLEIVDSRIRDWDISIVDTIADNGSSARFVLGSERRSLAQLVPKDVQMSMTSNGRVVSEGSGLACLGDPLNALLWLATRARDLGDPLRAGEIVLSGALGPMHSIAAGDSVRAELTGLGSVSIQFVEGVR
jgi:2-keto-4-pentenoate hydratase